MFGTIFRKQFAAYAATMLLSLSLLCGILIGFYRAHIIDEKGKMLSEEAKRITDIYSASYARNLDNFWANPGTQMQLSNELNAVSEYLDAVVVITDANFEINYYSAALSEQMQDKSINTGDYPDVLAGKVTVITGNLRGLLPEDSVTACYPVTVRGQGVKAIVFVSTSMADVNANIMQIISITLLCIAATAIVAFTLMFFMLKTISRPLKQMSEAAKIIADGHFDRKIDIKSRDEVGRLAGSFNEMAESLNSQERKRREFLANISHDLRSPLTSIRGFIGAVIDGTAPENEVPRYLNIVFEETERLSKLANDVLDINSLTPEGALNICRFDLNALIRKTLLMFENTVTERGIALHVAFDSGECLVSADYDKIQRALYNLLDNAVKFTGKDGSISVETAEEGGKVFVSVRDSGIGISEENQKKVFDRFYKADSSRGEDRSGSGLGLSIAREFLRAHGEDLTLNSEPGRGSEFRFSLKRE